MTRFCFFLFNIFFVLYIFNECQSVFKGIELVPERVEVDYMNPKYLGNNVTATVRRSSRGGQYVINVSARTKQLWGNNVSIYLYFYEFLSNEYRRSFVEINRRLCDYINDDPYGKLIQRYGVVCPLYANNWILRNVTLTFPTFPYVVPFTKCKVEVVFRRTVPTDDLMARTFLYVKIKKI